MKPYHLLLIFLFAGGGCQNKKQSVPEQTISVDYIKDTVFNKKLKVDTACSDTSIQSLYHARSTFYENNLQKKIEMDIYGMESFKDSAYENYSSWTNDSSRKWCVNDSIRTVSSSIGTQINFRWGYVDITLDPDSRVSFNCHHPNQIETDGHVYIGLPESSSLWTIKTETFTITLNKNSGLTVYNYHDGIETVDLSKGSAKVENAGQKGMFDLNAGERIYSDKRAGVAIYRSVDSAGMTGWRNGKVDYHAMEIHRALRLFNKWTGVRARLLGKNLLAPVDLNMNPRKCLNGYIKSFVQAGVLAVLHGTLLTVDGGSVKDTSTENPKLYHIIPFEFDNSKTIE